MTLSDLSIRRPVFAWMLMFGLIVFGAISFTRMGVSELPDVDFPMITINARYEGAAPEVMEADVVDPLEDVLVSIQGLKNLSAVARSGNAEITLEFEMSRNIDLAFQDVQAKLSQAAANLPKRMDPLTVMKINPEDFPILWLSVASDRLSLPELMLLVKDEVRDKFTTVPGVGSLWTPGYLEPNLRVWVDNEKLRRYALSVVDVVNAIRSEHTEPPSGRAEFQKKEYSLRTLGEARTAEQFSNLLINSRGGGPNYTPIPLRDVARTEEGTADTQTFARSNGKTAVGLGVVKQRGANAVSVAKAVKKRIEALSRMLPEGTRIVLNYDGTRFVEDSIHELVLTLLLSAVFTSLVCWLFLGSWAATFNVLLSIPTSVLGSFIILYFAGFTLNVFTLLGLSLAIGIVVDDAIMVLENIIRHRHLGQNRREAALFGAREITFAAVATSVSLVAIFLPIAFMQGLVGRFLFQFGVTLSAAVLISLVEALTLTPMRAALFKDSEAVRGRLGRGMDGLFHRLRASYHAGLERALSHRWKVVSFATVFFVVSIGSAKFLKSEFQPAQDMSAMTILLNNAPGSGLSYTDDKVKVVEAYLARRPEVQSYFVAAGGFSAGEPQNAMVFVEFVPRAKRSLSQGQLIEETRAFLAKSIPESNPQVQDPSTQGFGGGGSRGFPAEFTIQGPDWTKLADFSRQIVASLKSQGIMTDLSSDLLEGAPEVHIIPDRKRASEHGVDVASIGTVVNALLGGTVAGTFPKGGHRYEIRVKLTDENRHPAERVRDFWVRNNRGQLVSLASLVRVEEAKVPSAISRKNRQRSILIFGNLGPGKSQQEVLELAEKTAKNIMGEGYSFQLAGSAEEFTKGFLSFAFALLLGFLVAYMILATQFNSFLDPVTVFVAMPFSFSGAFLGLLATGQTMNLYSLIGLILLMGIVKKNSILLVDFTNQRREQEGLPVRSALLAACPDRLRPILMTSIATIAGALPAALSLGPGAEVRRPMAVTVIGGVLVSTLLTLYVVPCVYSLLARRRESDSQKEAVATAALAS